MRANSRGGIEDTEAAISSRAPVFPSQILPNSARDVGLLDIRFQFRMAGYSAVFYYPVPVLAQLFPETGYLNRIIEVQICGP